MQYCNLCHLDDSLDGVATMADWLARLPEDVGKKVAPAGCVIRSFIGRDARLKADWLRALSLTAPAAHTSNALQCLL